MADITTDDDDGLVKKLQALPTLLDKRSMEKAINDSDAAGDLGDTLDECSRLLWKRARSMAETETPPCEIIEIVARTVAAAKSSSEVIIFLDQDNAEVFEEFRDEVLRSIMLIIIGGSRLCNGGDDSVLLTQCLRVLGSNKFSVEERTTATVIITKLYAWQSEILHTNTSPYLSEERVRNFLTVAKGLELFLDSLVNTTSTRQAEGGASCWFEGYIKLPEELFQCTAFQTTLVSLHDLLCTMFSRLDRCLEYEFEAIALLGGEASYFDFMLKVRAWSEKTELQLQTLLLRYWHEFTPVDLWPALCSNMWTEAIWQKFHTNTKDDPQYRQYLDKEGDGLFQWTAAVKSSLLKDLIPSLVDKDPWLLSQLFSTVFYQISNGRTAENPVPFDKYRSSYLYLVDLLEALLYLMGRIDCYSVGYELFLFPGAKWDKLLNRMWNMHDIFYHDTPPIRSVPSTYEFSLSMVFMSHRELWRVARDNDDSVRQEILNWMKTVFQNDCLVIRLTAIKFFLSCSKNCSTLSEVLSKGLWDHFLSSDSSELLLPESIEQGKPMLFACAALASVGTIEIHIPDPLKLIRVSHELKTAFFPPSEVSEVQEEDKENNKEETLASRSRMWQCCSYAVEYLPLDLASTLLTTPACSYLHDSKDEDEALLLALTYLMPLIKTADLFQLIRYDSHLRAIMFHSDVLRDLIFKRLRSNLEASEECIEEKVLVIPLLEIVCSSSKRDPELIGYFHSETGCSTEPCPYKCLVETCGSILQKFISSSEALHQKWASHPEQLKSSKANKLSQDGEVVARLLAPILEQYADVRAARGTEEDCTLDIPNNEELFLDSLLDQYPRERLIERATRELLEVFGGECSKLSHFYHGSNDLLEGDVSRYRNWALGFLPTVTDESFPDRLELSIQDSHRLLFGGRYVLFSIGRPRGEETLKRGILGIASLLKTGQHLISSLADVSAAFDGFSSPSTSKIYPPKPDQELQRGIDTIVAVLKQIALREAKYDPHVAGVYFSQFLTSCEGFKLTNCFMLEFRSYLKEAIINLVGDSRFCSLTMREVEYMEDSFGVPLKLGRELYNIEQRLSCLSQATHSLSKSVKRPFFESLFTAYWILAPVAKENVNFQLNLWLEYFKGKSCDKEQVSNWLTSNLKRAEGLTTLPIIFRLFFSTMETGLRCVTSTEEANKFNGLEEGKHLGPCFVSCFQECERLLAEYLLVVGALEAEEERQENIDSFTIFVPQLKEMEAWLVLSLQQDRNIKETESSDGVFLCEILSTVKGMFSMLGVSCGEEKENEEGPSKKRRRIK